MTHCFIKTKLNDTHSYVAQNSYFSKMGSYFTEKIPAGFPSDVWRLLCPSASFYFSGAVTSNNPVLQLQLRPAGRLHVAFRNLRESQSWGRAVVGHHLHKIWPGFTQIVVLCDVWTCIVTFCFCLSQSKLHSVMLISQTYYLLFDYTSAELFCR